MAQQTAIEWFIDNLPIRFKNIITDICHKEIIQAKQMETDQSDRDYNHGFSNGYSEGYDKGMSDYNRF
jgi:hypothetical protein